MTLTPSVLTAAQRIRRSAGAELVASLGLLKVPARELKRALEEAAAVRADPNPNAWHRFEWCGVCGVAPLRTRSNP